MRFAVLSLHMNQSIPIPPLRPLLNRAARHSFRAPARAAFIRGLGLVVGAAFLAGCSSPAVRQQRLVSKPNMLFSDSSAFTYNSARLLPQLEPGAATSGGAQNAGCTSCR